MNGSFQFYPEIKGNQSYLRRYIRTLNIKIMNVMNLDQNRIDRSEKSRFDKSLP